jgi:UDP-N-acetylmuramyl pentapeptide phosphotransferase/UDP-N-acetylglucosamine-1-phosphate transferase
MSHLAADIGAMAAAAVFVLAAAISVAIIVAIRPWLQRIALAKPNTRSSHTVPTPQGGGMAVVAATIIAASGASYLSVATASAAAPLLPVFAAVIVIAAVGAADDIRPIGVAPRLLLQALAVALVIFTLPDDLRIAPFIPWWIERVLLVLGGLWFVNLVNFMDGLDWMTVAEVVPVTAAVAIIGAFGLLPPAAMMVSLALCGAMLGFAYFNRPTAKLFLGDVGSLPVGLLLGWLLVQLAGHGGLAAAILLPLYYLADSTITLIRRAINGEKVWQAHRSHFYQRATDRGLTVGQVVAYVFAVNIALAALASVTLAAPGRLNEAAALICGAALVGWLLFAFARGRGAARRRPRHSGADQSEEPGMHHR